MSNYPDGISTGDIPGHTKRDEDIDNLENHAVHELGREPTDDEWERIMDAWDSRGWDAAMSKIVAIAEAE